MFNKLRAFVKSVETWVDANGFTWTNMGNKWETKFFHEMKDGKSLNYYSCVTKFDEETMNHLTSTW